VPAAARPSRAGRRPRPVGAPGAARRNRRPAEYGRDRVLAVRLNLVAGTRESDQEAEPAPDPGPGLGRDPEAHRDDPEDVDPYIVDPYNVDPYNDPDDDDPDDDDPDDAGRELEDGGEERFGRDPSRVDLGSSGEYGVDAPGVVRNLAFVALGAFAVMFLGALASVPVVMVIGLVVGIVVAIVALMMLSSSRVGKLGERVRIIDAVGLSADDYVLDLGCGRGLLLTEAARRVPDGLAIGVDLWSEVDQSRNVPAAPLANAAIERVDDRVDVVTGDGRNLPFVDGAFDAVVSSMVVHNIPDSVGRARVIREASRVLRPGGRLVVVDMRRSAEYVAVLRAQHWSDVRRSRARWRLFPPVRYVSGTKPDPEATR